MIAWFSVLVVGICSSFIGTLVGGGALISLPILMLLGIPVQVSIASTKFSSALGALTSVTYLWKGRHLPAASIVSYLLVAAAGGVTGAFLTSSVSEQTMKKVAVVLMVFALAVIFGSKGLWNKQDEKEPAQAGVPGLKTAIYSYLITVYDGGFGPGSTTFGILQFMQNGHSYAKAVQMTRVLILGSCVGGFFVFLSRGFVEWSYAIPMGIGCIVGSQLGLVALPRIPLKLARSLLMAVIVVLIGQVSLDLLRHS